MTDNKTIGQMLAMLRKEHGKGRKSPSDEEHRIQRSCVTWFGYRYPELRGRLFAVPNGGKRDEVTAARMKAEGQTAGVSDLVLLRKSGRYGALLIEMKTERGRLSENQKRWKEAVTRDGEYRYVVSRSLEGFIAEVENYLAGKNDDE